MFNLRTDDGIREAVDLVRRSGAIGAFGSQGRVRRGPSGTAHMSDCHIVDNPIGRRASQQAQPGAPRGAQAVLSGDCLSCQGRVLNDYLRLSRAELVEALVRLQTIREMDVRKLTYQQFGAITKELDGMKGTTDPLVYASYAQTRQHLVHNAGEDVREGVIRSLRRSIGARGITTFDATPTAISYMPAQQPPPMSLQGVLEILAATEPDEQVTVVWAPAYAVPRLLCEISHVVDEGYNVQLAPCPNRELAALAGSLLGGAIRDLPTAITAAEDLMK